MKKEDRNSYLISYINKGCKSVEGWASPLLFERVMRLNQIQEQLGITGHVCEIGVHHGKLFILLHLLRKTGEKGVAVDLFEQQDLNVDKSGKGDRSIFSDNVKRLTDSTSDLEILGTDSTQISGDDLISLAGGKIRLLSIDGGHLKHIVAHDLKTAAQCLVEGGVVLVDDFLNPEFPGVLEGTLAFLNSTSELEPFCVSTQKLYLTTKGHGETFTRLLYEAETKQSFDIQIKYNFVAGTNSPVRIADFLDCEVLCYSDDEYDFSERLNKSIVQAKGNLRDNLSESNIWRTMRKNPVGKLIKSIANRVLPYN